MNGPPLVSTSLRVATLVAGLVAASMLGTISIQATTTVSIDPDAKLVRGGSVLARLTITCDPGREVLEAHLTISQDAQRISGTAPISRIRCDNRPHTVKVTVTPLEGAFHEGEAFASAFILRMDPNTGTTEQGQDSHAVTVN
jgi:hypothetical protein